METFLASMLCQLVWAAEGWLMVKAYNYFRYTRLGLPMPFLANSVDLKVLHRSDNFLVVDKNYDLLINSDTSDLTLYGQVQRQFPHLCDDKYKFGFRVLHRLDYSTSGVYVIPLNAKSCSSAGKAFSGRSVAKFYLAILRGHVASNLVWIKSVGIGEDSRPKWKNIKMCSDNKEYCANPRKAETKLAVISRGVCGGYPATKVLLRPITGRRHQLRVHCHELGHRIVGDFTYSDRRDILPYRMYLHSHRIVLPNAVEDLDVSAGDPFASAAADYVPVEHSKLTMEEIYRLLLLPTDDENQFLVV